MHKMVVMMALIQQMVALGTVPSWGPRGALWNKPPPSRTVQLTPMVSAIPFWHQKIALLGRQTMDSGAHGRAAGVQCGPSPAFDQVWPGV